MSSRRAALRSGLMILLCACASTGTPPAEVVTTPPASRGEAPNLLTLVPADAASLLFVDFERLRGAALAPTVGDWLVSRGLPPGAHHASPFLKVLVTGPLGAEEPELMLFEHILPNTDQFRASTGREEWGSSGEVAPHVMAIAQTARFEALRRQVAQGGLWNELSLRVSALWGRGDPLDDAQDGPQAAGPSLVLAARRGPGRPAPTWSAIAVSFDDEGHAQIALGYRNERQATAAETAWRALDALMPERSSTLRETASTLQVSRALAEVNLQATVPAGEVTAFLDWAVRATAGEPAPPARP